MSTVEEARAALLVEVRDCMLQTPIVTKNERWIDGTMQAADAYALAVLEQADDLLEAGLNEAQCYAEAHYLLAELRTQIEQLGKEGRDA